MKKDVVLKDAKGTIRAELINLTDGKWISRINDEFGNELIFLNSEGYWARYTRDERGNEIGYENSEGFKSNYELDKDGFVSSWSHAHKTI